MSNLQCDIYKKQFQPLSDKILEYLHRWEDYMNNGSLKIVYFLGLLETYLANKNANATFGTCSKYAHKYLNLKMFYASITDCALFYKIASNPAYNILKLANKDLIILLSKNVADELNKNILSTFTADELKIFNDPKDTIIPALKNVMNDTYVVNATMDKIKMNYFGNLTNQPATDLLNKYSLIVDPVFALDPKNFNLIANAKRASLFNDPTIYDEKYVKDAEIVLENIQDNSPYMQSPYYYLCNLLPFYDFKDKKCTFNIEIWKKTEVYKNAVANDFKGDPSKAPLPEFKAFSSYDAHHGIVNETEVNIVLYGYIPLIRWSPDFLETTRGGTKIIGMKPYGDKYIKVLNDLRKEISNTQNIVNFDGIKMLKKELGINN